LAAAAALKRPVVLLSGPGAAGYAGPGWFLAIVRQAHAAHPGAKAMAVLDCGGQPGRALGALRMGARTLRAAGAGAAGRRVAAIAASMGATIDDRAYATLDLQGAGDATMAVTAFLREAGVSRPSRRSRPLAPQDDASMLSNGSPSRPPGEDRRSVSKDERRRKRK